MSTDAADHDVSFGQLIEGSRSESPPADWPNKVIRLGISTESGDVVIHPFHRQSLIEESHVLIHAGETRETEYIESIAFNN